MEEAKVEEAKVRSDDMTRGNPWRLLIAFAIPVLLGSLLQQLYNAVDAIIVGQVVGSTALGAVGSTASIVQLMIALFMGLSSGACVVVARFYGKKDKENLSKTVHTAMLLSVIIGIALSIIGVVLSPVILRWMNTPPEMMQDATTYLQIFFAGMTGLAIYNMGASILQAVGNSRYPLYFLLTTTVLNVIGDLVFTAGLNMGVAGAAWATIISETVSAVLVVLVLTKSKREYKLNLKKLKIDKDLLKQIIAIGLPSAIQHSIVSVSNIMVQSYINGLGPEAVAGYSVTNKIDAFLPLPISAMALAVTTYVSQNLGAGDAKRARKGVLISVLVGLSATLVLSAFTFLFHEAVFSLFSSDKVVIDNAWRFAQVIIPFYVFLAITQVLPGALRGSGNVKFATSTCIGCYVVLRQIYLFFITKQNYSILTVAACYPFTWTVCAIIILIYYLKKGISYDKIKLAKIVRTDIVNADFLKLCKKLDAFQNKTVPGRRQAGLSSVYNSENLKDIFLLYDGPKVIGSAVLWRHDDETCEAVRVYVDSTYRGKGFEQILIDEVQNLAKSLGYKQILLRTYSTTPSIVEAYEKIGFSHIQPTDFKYADKYSQALLLAPLRIYMKRDLI